MKIIRNNKDSFYFLVEDNFTINPNDPPMEECNPEKLRQFQKFLEEESRRIKDILKDYEKESVKTT